MAIVTPGEEAMAAAAASAPEIVIMDVGLSGHVKGTEATKGLWEKFRVPIIFLTGNADQTMLTAAQGSMAYAFLFKPHHAGHLHSVIQLALSEREQERK